mmetsp:Transcript_4773/g.9472  ORF Transcript_4773/g.9472 Transcript_4773/m.9472 type:complete len:216 (+) Transcript_4773:490-1137(+)
MSANLRSSKIRKLCFSASFRSASPNAGLKSDMTSTCVLRTHTWGPTLSASSSTSLHVPRSAATDRLDFLASMMERSCLASALPAISALLPYDTVAILGLSFAAFGAPLEVGSNWFSLTNARTFSQVAASIFPAFSSTSMNLVTVRALLSTTPPSVIRSGPPCCRSSSTTACVQIRPSSLRDAAVSRTLMPLVTTSSTIRQFAPCLYTPSTIFLVP